MQSSPKAPTSRGTPSRRGKSPNLHRSGSALSSSKDIASDSFVSKPAATFFSCLDIPVEGAVPIESDPPANVRPLLPDVHIPIESKRAPRKSKTEAMVALSSQIDESPLLNDESATLNILAERYRNVPPIPVAPTLDLSTVKTTSPRGYRAPLGQERPFGLQNCPEYFPTDEQFKDPMSYVRSIADSARPYGICKIIPPKGWKMPFVTNTETFRFSTRLQRLNSIEASCRAKLNFLEQLYKFHSQQGNPRIAVPTINHKPLDLWLLRKEVQKLGGYEAVCKAKKWSDIGRLLGYRGVPGLSTQVKTSYARVIVPFEDFCERAAHLPAREVKIGIPNSRPSNPIVDESTLSSPISVTSSPLSEPPEDDDSKDVIKGSRAKRGMRFDSHEDPPKKVSTGPVVPLPVFYDKSDIKETLEQHCEICSKKNRGEEMLLCDGCDCGFHMFCLDPPLDTIPKEQWFCYTCLAGTGGDFGFDEGEEHSLSSFQARDKEFRRVWFETHAPQNGADMDYEDSTVNTFGTSNVTEYDLENEFWRLVQSPHETVEVEYGADVHSTTHGSGMPTMETHPLNPYSKDPWNLNNIPIVPDSLLRFIKSDISGMTVPWTYVGMTFSTFCWHNEDHYTYSINFMHWGETKTWYGIPGEDADKFEAAIKNEAPDLFEGQPDLLFQLVTLMNPQRLTEAGVNVYACNQRAGEFVITFPKSYHSGFNHGLNFNEAVNFALPDWLPYDLACVERYRNHRKHPVFSHDELLITITQQSQTIKTAIWLLESLQEMYDREMKDRDRARTLNISEVIEDKADEQYQCSVCKVFCYLSQVVCPCTKKVACVEHSNLLCERSLDHLTIRKRFSDEDLSDIFTKVKERANIPGNWRAKYLRTVNESARPPLRTLRTILSEGERIGYPLPELPNLRKCVQHANEWVEIANTFIVRKQSRKRARKARGRASHADVDESADRPDRTLGDLYVHLHGVENLGFDSLEITQLRNLAQQAESMRESAAAILKAKDTSTTKDEFITECKRLILEASSLNVHLDEVVEIEKIVDREQLILDLEDRIDQVETPLTMDEIRQLLARCDACNLDPNNEHLLALEEQKRIGEDWEEKAQAILSQSIRTIGELDEFVNLDSSIPIDSAIVDRILSAHAKAVDFEKQANAWLEPDTTVAKPRAQDVIRLVTRAEKDYSIPAIQQLKTVAQAAIDYENRAERVLKRRYAFDGSGDDDDHVFQTMENWVDLGKGQLKIFSMPVLDKLAIQLVRHHEWLERLPWWCTEHQQPEGQSLLEDVLMCTLAKDDGPPTDEYMTCICTEPVRPPPPGVKSDAVQCDHCFARFHGECAKNGGSCPFCDHHHWNGEIAKERAWHFCFLPNLLNSAPEISRTYSEDFKELEIIIHRVDRLSSVIGQFLSYTAQPANQRYEYIDQVRHYMRKLYKLQFALSPNPDVSFGLDLAGLHRILASRRTNVNAKTSRKRSKRPKFVFGQDVDPDWADGTRCICRGRTAYLLNYQSINCESCGKKYHASCVFYPRHPGPAPYLCPICCLRKGKSYIYSDVRVQGMASDNLPGDIYIDTKKMVEMCATEPIYLQLERPYQSTLFVELISFTPGQSDGPSASLSTSRQNNSNRSSQPISPHRYPRSVLPTTIQPYTGIPVQPPWTPPWPRWGISSSSRPPVSGPSRPSSGASRSAPQKRSISQVMSDENPADAAGPSKRRVTSQSSTTPPPPPIARPVHHNLSPSLAMIMSPPTPPPLSNEQTADKVMASLYTSGAYMASMIPARGDSAASSNGASRAPRPTESTVSPPMPSMIRAESTAPSNGGGRAPRPSDSPLSPPMRAMSPVASLIRRPVLEDPLRPTVDRSPRGEIRLEDPYRHDGSSVHASSSTSPQMSRSHLDSTSARP